MTIVTRTTRLIESDTMRYPLFLGDMGSIAPNTMFGPTVDSDCLIDFGVEVVNEVPIPEGDVVTEGVPVLTEGEWYQTWTVRTFSEVELSEKLASHKEILKSQATQLVTNAFAVGFPYLFPNDTVYHVQVRSSDRGNISDLRTIAKEILAETRPAMDFPFRVYENVSVMLTPQQMVDLADKTLVQVLGGYQVSWNYKDAIDAATTMEDLPAPPVAFFVL